MIIMVLEYLGVCKLFNALILFCKPRISKFHENVERNCCFFLNIWQQAVLSMVNGESILLRQNIARLLNTISSSWEGRSLYTVALCTRTHTYVKTQFVTFFEVPLIFLITFVYFRSFNDGLIVTTLFMFCFLFV